MATFSIQIWSSTSLYNDKGTGPIDNVELYLDKAINDQSQHTAYLNNRGTNTIDAPQQVVFQSFNAVDPCDPYSDPIYYDNLGQWWMDEVSCNQFVDDCHLLITDAENTGGITYNNRAAVAGGAAVSGLTMYDRYGCTHELNEMWAIMHEVGHALITDSNINDHETGYTYQYGGISGGTMARTPFGREGVVNECGEYIDYADGDCVGMEYSDCAESHMG